MSRLAPLLFLPLLLGSCRPSVEHGEAGPPPARSTEPDGARARGTDSGTEAGPAETSASGAEAVPAAAAGAMVEVAEGVVLAGSRPGTPGRSPEVEMDGSRVVVPAFRIDALPHPNDPARPSLVGVPHARARELCEAEGKRLCTELEWERVCEGEDGRVYPYGDEHDPARHDHPTALSSPAGVLGLGTIGEWTASPWAGPVDGRPGGLVVRGPGPGPGDAASMRCARRSAALPGGEQSWIGFRCCGGPPPEGLVYVVDDANRPFERLEELEVREPFQAMIRAVPELERLHDDPRPFDRQALHDVMHRSGLAGPQSVPGTWFTWQPVRWIPVQGEQIVVATGIDGEDSFVVALWELPDGGYAHAASLVFVGTAREVVLSYTRDRRHLVWMPCLGCRDGGLLTYENGAVSISQRW